MDLNETVHLKVNNPKIAIEDLTFSFSEKAIKIIQDRKYSMLTFDVEFIEENCARIFNPIIKPQVVKPENLESSPIIIQIASPIPLSIQITPSFSENFPKTTRIEIQSSGWVRKTLIFENIEPKIINVC